MQGFACLLHGLHTDMSARHAQVGDLIASPAITRDVAAVLQRLAGLPALRSTAKETEGLKARVQTMLPSAAAMRHVVLSTQSMPAAMQARESVMHAAGHWVVQAARA